MLCCFKQKEFNFKKTSENSIYLKRLVKKFASTRYYSFKPEKLNVDAYYTRYKTVKKNFFQLAGNKRVLKNEALKKIKFFQKAIYELLKKSGFLIGGASKKLGFFLKRHLTFKKGRLFKSENFKKVQFFPKISSRNLEKVELLQKLNSSTIYSRVNYKVVSTFPTLN